VGGNPAYNTIVATRSPDPISLAETQRRLADVTRLARSVGFVGRIEYRHAYSRTGGAQYGRGADADSDLLLAFAEAFERDADPEDFSLLALVAHERGHQLLAWHPRLSGMLAGVAPAAEEALASLLGALVLGPGSDRDALVAKATAEVLPGMTYPDDAVRLVERLWVELGGLS